MVLFYESMLYSEAILYTFYIFMAGYGYFIWRKGRDGIELPITDILLPRQIKYVMTGLIMGVLLGFGMERYTEADLPFVDAQTTSFSFIATFLEAHKVVFGWIIWIVVNGSTIVLYGYKDLYFYAGLMVIYLVLSVYGYIDWKKKLSILNQRID